MKQSPEQHIFQIMTSVPAWVTSGVVVALVVWIGDLSILSILIALLLGGLVFASLTLALMAQPRIIAMKNEVRDSHLSEARMQKTLNEVPGLLWRSGLDLNRIYIGSMWSRFTGQPVDRAMKNGWLECVHPTDQPRCETAHRAAAASGGLYELEYRLRAAGGQSRWVLDRALPTCDAHGRVRGYVGVTVDIDERHRCETARAREHTELIESNKELSDRLQEFADQADELRDLITRLERADQLKAEHLQGIAKSLSEPVGEVANAVGMLKASGLDKQQKETVDRALGAVDKVEDWHRRASELGAAAASAGVEHPIDLRSLIDDVTEVMTLRAREQRMSVSCKMANDVPAIVAADRASTRQSLSDLWEAALRVAKCSPVEMTVSCEDQAFDLVSVFFAVTIRSKGLAKVQIDRLLDSADLSRFDDGELSLGESIRIAERSGARMGANLNDDDDIVLWLTLKVKVINPGCDGRRAHGRLLQEFVTCDIGQVIELSTSGMRIRCRNDEVPEGEFPITIRDETTEISLRAEVVWSKRVSMRATALGMRFIDPDPKIVATLTEFASRNRKRRSLEAA